MKNYCLTVKYDMKCQNSICFLLQTSGQTTKLHTVLWDKRGKAESDSHISFKPRLRDTDLRLQTQFRKPFHNYKSIPLCPFTQISKWHLDTELWDFSLHSCCQLLIRCSSKTEMCGWILLHPHKHLQDCCSLARLDVLWDWHQTVTPSSSSFRVRRFCQRGDRTFTHGKWLH